MTVHHWFENEQKAAVSRLSVEGQLIPEEFSLTCMIMDPNERYIYCGTSEGSVLLFSVLDIGLPVNKLRTTSESIESVIRLYRNYYLLGLVTGGASCWFVPTHTLWGIL